MDFVIDCESHASVVGTDEICGEETSETNVVLAGAVEIEDRACANDVEVLPVKIGRDEVVADKKVDALAVDMGTDGAGCVDAIRDKDLANVEAELTITMIVSVGSDGLVAERDNSEEVVVVSGLFGITDMTVIAEVASLFTSVKMIVFVETSVTLCEIVAVSILSEVCIIVLVTVSA